MRPPAARLALLLALALLPGCEPEIRFVTWEPLDPEEIRQALDAPSGHLDPDTLEEVTAELNRHLEDLLRLHELLAWLHDLLTTSPPTRTRALAASTAGTTTAQGTSVYLELACPGPAMAWPAPAFEHGHLRIDSARFQLEDAEIFLQEGDALLRFRACILGPTTVTGQAPAYWDAANGVLALGFDLVFDNVEPDEAPGERAFLQALLDAEELSVLVGDTAGDTYRATLNTGEDGELRLAGANLEIVCAIAGGRARCEF